MRLVIVGIGKNGKKLLSFPLKTGVEIVALFDNDGGKWGTEINGKKIRDLSGICSIDFDKALIVAPGSASIDMKEQLLALGVSEDKIVIARDA